MGKSPADDSLNFLCVCFHPSMCRCALTFPWNTHTHTRTHTYPSVPQKRVKREIDFSKRSRQPSPAERLRCFLHSTQLPQQITDTCWLVFSLVAKDLSRILMTGSIDLYRWVCCISAPILALMEKIWIFYLYLIKFKKKDFVFVYM